MVEVKELSTKIKLLLHWRYFITGYTLTNYLKYIIAFFGLASRDVKWTMIFAISYGFLSYIVGWIWFKYNLADADAEISNIYNPLAAELRQHINEKNKRKL